VAIVPAQLAALQGEEGLGPAGVVEEMGQGVVHEVVGHAEVEHHHLRGQARPLPLQLQELLVGAVAGHGQVDDLEAGIEPGQAVREGLLIGHAGAEGDGVAEHQYPAPGARARGR
jgi:hypothetical protein